MTNEAKLAPGATTPTRARDHAALLRDLADRHEDDVSCRADDPATLRNAAAHIEALEWVARVAIDLVDFRTSQVELAKAVEPLRDVDRNDCVADRLCGSSPCGMCSAAELRFVVPHPPKAWARARSNGKARYTDPAMDLAKLRVATAAAEAMAGRDPLTGPVALIVDANQRRKETSTPDADNLGKLIADAIQGIVFANDSQVVDFRVRKTDVRRESADADPWTGVTVVPVRWDDERGWVPREEDGPR